ncbi:Crp/Fnr family transcriptional regulator [Streptomyces sp. SID3343]|uniref:Crp/Fnr family transcriptional regulator n=1 Tax=Streptomyces sp. SID3343 TaxID=2690260 RepID=UPI001368D622|nr:Crp/Fnr family transcriptional regulator [Streptomyces sp. SID3343]MYW00278.1 cyclic nucleotide-binding domain-containing protein [Streptomyces sp. SID3343]
MAEDDKALPKELSDVLRMAGRRLFYDRGDALFMEGDHPRHVVLIEHGQVKIERATADGSAVTIAVRGPGELVGELACIDGRGRSATVVALGPVTAVLVPLSRFRDLLNTNAPLVYAILIRTVLRIRESDRWRVEYGALATGRRVARALADRTFGSTNGPFVIRTTQQELADAIGVSRESVVRALRVLQESELVRTRRGSIVVPDPPALREWADG